jgi:hypothetical protein
VLEVVRIPVLQPTVQQEVQATTQPSAIFSWLWVVVEVEQVRTLVWLAPLVLLLQVLLTA